MYKVIFPHQFEDGSMRVVGHGFHKLAKHVPDEIAQGLAVLDKQAGTSYIHLIALGENETWGSNVNGDAFPRQGLMSKGASHGYKTFEKFAHVYRHHVNKDPSKAMGKVAVAAWNPVMRRVELLAGVDNERGKHLIEKVADGDFPDWSMGCKVPFDECSVCWHKAATMREYCEHLKGSMNKIAEDGRRICAINAFPKFFDISEVIVGADKTAKTLRKVASERQSTSSAMLGLVVYGEDQEKDAEGPKIAEIEKEIPVAAQPVSPAAQAQAQALLSYEPALPAGAIRKLASLPLKEALSTLSYTGIVLQPQEFQDLVLLGAGKEKLARELGERGIRFVELIDGDFEGQVERDRELVHPDHITKEAFDPIGFFLSHRSILEPYLSERVERITHLPAGRFKHAAPQDFSWTKTADPGLFELLGALGLAYFAYRKGMPVEAHEFEGAVVRHPWLAPVILGGTSMGLNLLDAIAGPSSAARSDRMLTEARTKVGVSWKSVATVVGPIGLAYLASASARRKEMEGRDLNGPEKVMRDYPALLGPLGVAGLVKARKMLASGKL